MKRILVCLILLLLLAACGEEPTPAPTPTITAVATTPTATAPAQPTATATTPPSPTPIRPGLAVDDQTIDEDGRLVITNVTVLEPSWLVIHAEREGQVGEVLGYTAVPGGVSSDVVVTINPLAATDQLAAIIHVDAGAAGVFEFPGVDEPLLAETAVTAQSFAIQRDLALPAITAADQNIIEDGLVRVASVTAPTPAGWWSTPTSRARWGRF
ncbi:MAG: hypothetical protein IPM39_19155 [Chloroflexi bacterium]|nr:hypothetical protein [Chloroflexota bacterium]